MNDEGREAGTGFGCLDFQGFDSFFIRQIDGDLVAVGAVGIGVCNVTGAAGRAKAAAVMETRLDFRGGEAKPAVGKT